MDNSNAAKQVFHGAAIPARAARTAWAKALYALRIWLARRLFTQEPLIWTKYGNMPERDLDCQVTWEGGEGYIACVHTHTYKGEVVKRSPHIFQLPAQPLSAQAGELS